MVGEAFGYLPGAELLLTGWPVPRRASPLPMLSRSGSSPGSLFVGVRPAARPQCQAPSRAGREVPATRSDSCVIIAMAEATRAYPVNARYLNVRCHHVTVSQPTLAFEDHPA